MATLLDAWRKALALAARLWNTAGILGPVPVLVGGEYYQTHLRFDLNYDGIYYILSGDGHEGAERPHDDGTGHSNAESLEHSGGHLASSYPADEKGQEELASRGHKDSPLNSERRIESKSKGGEHGKEQSPHGHQLSQQS